MLGECWLIHVNEVVRVDFLCNNVVTQEVGRSAYVAGVDHLLFTLPSLKKFVVVYNGFKVFVKVWKGNKLFLLSGPADLESPLIVDV